jgi:hypothetical protein
LCHGFGFKGFYPGRDKSALEGITEHLTMIRTFRRAPARCGKKDKEILKSDGVLWLLYL